MKALSILAVVLVAAGGALAQDKGTPVDCEAYASGDIDQFIPNSATSEYPITVAESVVIQQLTVTVDISHPHVGDLKLSLRSPGGTTVALSSFNGGSGANYSVTTFDDSAFTSVLTEFPPYNGSVRPEEALSAFNGANAKGDWKLVVQDNAAADTGAIHLWRLDICGTPGRECVSASAFGLPQPIPDNDAVNGLSVPVFFSEPMVIDDVNVTVNIAHSYDSDLSIGLVSPLGQVVGLSTGNGGSGDNYDNTTFDDEASTIISAGAPPYTGLFKPESPLSALDGSYAGGTWQLVVLDNSADDTGGVNYVELEICGTPLHACPATASTDTPRNIADAGTTESTINVAENVLVDDVNVVVNIQHGFDADLDISLLSPAGTEVILAADLGGTADNYTNTRFDDSAPVAITAGAPPFPSAYRPIGSLASFAGEEGAGAWRLRIVDDTSGDTGVLQDWSLEVCGEAITEGEGTTEGEGEGASAAGCDSGLILDDGTPGGNVGFTGVVSQGTFLNRLAPGTPYEISSVCICLQATEVVPAFTFDLQMYNEFNGQPLGVFHQKLNLTATNVGTSPTFYSFDVSDANFVSNSDEPFYIGLTYNPSTYPGIRVCVDGTFPSTAVSFRKGSGDQAFSPVVGGFGDNLVLMLRAAGEAVAPPACDGGIAVGSDAPGGGGSFAAGLTDVQIVTKLTAPHYPYAVTHVCPCFRSSGPATGVTYNVVIYAADGAGGTPGSLVNSVGPYFSDGISAQNGFFTTNVSGAGVVLTEGSYFVGVEWNPSTNDGAGFCSENGGAPRSYLQTNNSGGVWSEVQGAFGDSLLVPVRINGIALHSADTDGSGSFSLGELLRVVQLYNAGAFHCETGGEDGYATGAGDETCTKHNADYDGNEWAISLSELLRVVQLFNLGAHHFCGTGDDGFCPGE